MLSRNRGVGREILRRVARSGAGWIGFEHGTSASAAGELVAAELAREGLSLVDELEQRAIVDAALDRALEQDASGLSAVGEGVGFREAVANAVEALRLAGIGPERLECAGLEGSAKGAAVAALLAGYEAGLRAAKRVDAADVFRRAIQALGAGASLDDNIFLMPDLPTRGLASRFVQALAARGATILPSEPVAGLPPVAVLQAADVSPDALRCSFLHAVADAPAAAKNDPTIELFAASSPTVELREVLRRVMESGRLWDEVEIVATDPVAYGCALDALASRLGIPVTYAVGLPIERTRQGRATVVYLRWIQEGFPSSILRQLLETGDVRPVDDGAPSSERLAHRLRTLRVGWGRDRFVDTIDRALRWLDESPPPGGDEWRTDAEIAVDRARERAELVALRAVVTQILDATPPVPDRIGKGGRPISPAALARGLRAFLGHVPAPTPVEGEARKRLLERLAEIQDKLVRETTFGSAVTILRSHLDLRVPSPGAEGPLPWSSAGSAIHLSDLDHGGWTGRPLTFVVGLDADRFPGAGIQDPILLDADRLRLDPKGLPTAIERLAERRWDLAAMLARLRGTVTLSWSAWAADESREVAPASDLLQAFRLQQGNPDLDYEALHEAVRPIACPVPRGARLDAADVWLDALSERGILLAGVDRVLEGYPLLARGLQARDARQSPELTPWDGRIEPRPELDPRGNDRVLLSNSSLEGLSACPLRYFYSKVLRVRPPDDPELDPGTWLNALDRGSLLHDVYEVVLERARERGVDHEDEAFEALALEVLDEQVDRFRGKVPVPSEVVVRHEVDALKADTRSFVRHVRQHGADWIALEYVFGYGRGAPPPVEIALPGGTIRVCGRMDRVDERPDGRLTIVDYKSGSTYSYSARFGTWHGGRHLQHLVYARVARALYGREVAGMEYHFPSVKGQNQVIPYGVERLAEGERVLDALCELVARGHFVPTDEPDDCKFCDYQKICRVVIDDWNKIDSPVAEWGKTNAESIEEYAPLRWMRGIDA